MSGFIFGRPVNKSTQTALELKQDLASTRNTNNVNLGTAREFFNIRSPWVRLSSSVIINDSVKESYFNVQPGSELAKNNILTSFDLFQNQAVVDSTESDYYGGFHQRGEVSKITGVVSYDDFGPRPRPGITSVKVTSHGMYGALRTVSVSFKCWTPYQLDILDNLYMRPGYTMLLEFGYSHYLSKEGEDIRIENDAVSLNFFKDGYLTDSDDFEKVYTDIQDKKEQYGGSYEGFLGLVKNFNWSLQGDGSYDCSVDLVSKGEIIESLVANVGGTLSEEGKVQEETSIHRDLARLQNHDSDYQAATTFVAENVKYGQGTWWYIAEDFFQRIVDKRDRDKWSDRRFSYIYRQRFNSGESTETKFERQTYINFHLFNTIINRYVLRQAPDEDSSIIRMDTEFEGNTYYTNNIHISVNPLVCLLPKHGIAESFFKGFNLKQRPGQPQTSNSIGEILLNVEFLKKEISKNLNSTGTLEIKNLYDSIFTGIEDATGGINKFELHCDENNTFYILDRKKINTDIKPDQPLQLYGLNSVVKGLSLVSKLSPRLSTQIAISAQDKTSNLGLDATSFRQLNVGLSDSVTNEKQVNPQGVEIFSYEQREEEIVVKATKQVKTLQSTVNGLYLEKESIKVSFEKIKVLYGSFLNNSLEVSTTAHASFAIPFELTLTLDGTGGFTVGETFKIDSKLLPLSYKQILYNDYGGSLSRDSKVGFIITGLEQSVTSTSWDTIIKSQIYFSDDKVVVKPRNYIIEEKTTPNTKPQDSSPALVEGAKCSTSYSEFPFQEIPDSTELPYTTAINYLQANYTNKVARAVFAIMWAEASRNGRPGTAFNSAGGHNYSGIQTDSGRWSASGIIGQFCRFDGKKYRAFAIFENDTIFLDFMANRIEAKQIDGEDGDKWTASYILKWWSPEQKAEFAKPDSDKYKSKLAIYDTAMRYYEKFA